MSVLSVNSVIQNSRNNQPDQASTFRVAYAKGSGRSEVNEPGRVTQQAQQAECFRRRRRCAQGVSDPAQRILKVEPFRGRGEPDVWPKPKRCGARSS